MSGALQRITALARAGRLAEAEAACRQARLGDAEGLNLHGQILVRLGRPEEALPLLTKAVELRPDFAPAANNKGVALERLGRFAEAADAFRQALRVLPSPDIWFNLGNACRQGGDLPAAMRAYGRTADLAPERLAPLSALVETKQVLCDWDGLDALSARLAAGLEHTSEVVGPFQHLGQGNGEAIDQAVARRWAGRFSPQVRLAGPAADKDRLVVGYLAADFRAHAVLQLTAELFELHDRRRFTVNAYSLRPDDHSPMRRRVEAAFDSFVDCTGLDDQAAARRIAADGVDILVDLSGYTDGTRPGIAALRPAPVQAQWIGFPGTLGAPFVDYVLADAVVLPPSSEAFYDEAVVRLPGCYQINDRQRPLPAAAPPRASFGLPERGAVLACFNAPYKIRPADFAVWMGLLRQAEDAVLWLFSDRPEVEANLRRAAAAHRVDPGRLVFAPPVHREAHLARYRHVDLFLDTLPYGAHTTGSDALWMGCPVVTRLGDSFAGRVGASLLKAVGLERLVARSAGEYEAIALRLLRDPAERRAIRDHLENSRLSLPLFDTPAATRAVERAYEGMWARAVAGLPPRGFSVA